MHNNNEFITSTFYRFLDLDNFEYIKLPLLTKCNELSLKGTILIAPEGINSTISGTRESMNSLYVFLKDEFEINLFNIKETNTNFQPFNKMKVRLKKEIVALGDPDLVAEQLKGDYIEPNEWADFISRKDVITVDTRNKYETLIGSFDGAVDPETNNFREFEAWYIKNKESLKDKKIAMFCTGGVRCEKSTAKLKELGHNEVYHLKGGIINYFIQTKNVSKAWHGDLFVFDDRVVVDDSLKISHNIKCKSCNTLLKSDDIKATKIDQKLICIECRNE